MIIFKDIISGDELFTDIYPMKETSGLYIVEGKMAKEGTGFDNNLLGGANASAEDPAEEQYDANVVSGVNIVLSNRLVEMPMDKKGYQSYIKGYMKSIKAKLQEDNPGKVDDFMKSAAEAVKEILKEFKEYQFYCGESMNPDGMMCALKWEDGESKPIMRFFKHGLLEEKV